MNERYYLRLTAAAIRGRLKRLGKENIPGSGLMSKDIYSLTDDECEEILKLSGEADVQLYNFKTSHRDLPRIKKVLGFLHGITFDSLIDVGSGRGAFIIPFMDEFPHVKVDSIDILPKRTEMLEDMKNGGITNLNVTLADLCENPFGDNSFDVVTLLEVLEHIPDVKRAIASATAMACQAYTFAYKGQAHGVFQ